MKKNLKLSLVAGALLAGSSFAWQAQAQTTTINFAITQPAALQAGAGTNRNFCPGETLPLQATATGGTSPYTFAWGGTGVINPNSAQASVSPTATTTYTVAVTDANGCIATNTVTLTQIICTGISEGHFSGLTLFPNPARNQVALNLKSGTATAYQIRLTNMLGQEIAYRKVAPTDNLQEVISLEGLAKGVYLLHLNNQEGTAIRKLIVE